MFKNWILGVVMVGVVCAASNGQPADSKESTQQAFDSPKAAVDKLFEACKENDSAALVRMFGPRYRDAIARIDDAEEKDHRKRFWKQSQAYLKLMEKGTDRVELVVGRDLFTFPIPIVKESRGWVFATEEGFKEMLARRVGENELTAIEVCREFVKAQVEYAAADRDDDEVLEYAQQIASSPGKRDGLYWDVNADSAEPLSPLGDLLAEADGTPKERKPGSPYMGYYFKILKRQGSNPPGGKYDYVINGNMIAGFALLAWPADYRESGVMTFLVNQSGKVYEKDLKEDTAKIVQEMTDYDPDKSWALAKDR